MYSNAWYLLAPFLVLTACVNEGIKIGGGSASPVSGAASETSSSSSVELQRCTAPKATIAIELAGAQNQQVFYVNQLPPDPLPAMRLIAQQTGCFRIVHRDVALRNIEAERRLNQAGELRSGSNFGGGQIVAADYTLLLEVVVNNPNTSGSSFIGGGLIGLAIAGIAASNRTHEAGVILTVVDNRTSLQLSSASGKASGKSFNLGGLFGAAGGVGGGIIGAGGYENTDQGKVVMGAMIDAMNATIPHIQSKPIS